MIKSISFLSSTIALLALMLIANSSKAQCTVDYFGFLGDSPVNTANATVQNSITGVSASAMAGGAGVALTNTTESGNTGSANVFRVGNLSSNTSFTTAVTNNDYIFTTISVTASYNIIRLGRIRMKNIGGTSSGRGASIWSVQIYDVTAGTSTTIFQDVAIADGATSDVTNITPFNMLPGRNYQVRMFVYGLSGGANTTTRSYDNPVLSFNAIPVLSGTTANVCPGSTYNLNSLISNTNVSTTNTTLKWYSNIALTTEVTSPTTASPGMYYPSYRDNTNSCNNPYPAEVSIVLDSDCDGINNNVDLDDDNDGILDVDENGYCNESNSIITTLFFENFGTQSTANGTTSVSSPYTNYSYYSAVVGTTPTNSADGAAAPYSMQDGRYTIFNNIQNTSNWANTIWQTIGDHTNGGTTPTAGRMAIFNASYATGEFYKRTLTGIVSGLPLSISFWAMNIDVEPTGRILPNITVRIQEAGNPSNILHSISTGDITVAASGSASAWKNFKNNSLFIPASSIDLEIVFINNSTGGNGNDLAIDDILVYQTFCDTDHDSIPSYLDLDSDNDGCADALEGAGPFLASDLNPNGSLSGAVDANGVPTIAAGGQGTAIALTDSLLSYSCQIYTDNDGDNISPLVDLDDDNDGISDLIECGGTDPFADADSDGIPNYQDPSLAGFLDANGDGINDNFDKDKDGIINSIDLDSDNDGILDVSETGQTDINNDGKVDNFIDVNNNGILDSVDPSCQPITNTTTTNFNGLSQTNTSVTNPANILGASNATTAVFDAVNDVINIRLGDGSTGVSLPNTTTVTIRLSKTAAVAGLLGSTSGTTQFTVSQSTDGSTYTNPVVYSPTTSLANYTYTTNAANVQYIRIVLTSRESGTGVGGSNGTGIAESVTGSFTTSTTTNPCGSTVGTAISPIDTDGDGISNYLDLDSDNDGIADIVESGGVDTNGDGRIDGSTDTDHDGIRDVYDANNGGDANVNADNDLDGIKNYLDLDSDNDGIPDVIEAGGTDADNNGKIDGFTDTDADGFSQNVDGDATNDGIAENTAAALIITGADTDSDGVPNSWTRGNTDGTGYPNPYDLDSDDDGILDVREAGFTDATNDGIADGTLGADGWSDTVDALANLNIPNTDSHGSANYLDIDSDNDGIVDNIEAQSTAGYIAPSGSDTDGDGIDNAYDNNDAAFGGNATNGLALVNTDAADNADYLDLDSDNDGKTDRLEGWDTNGNGLINGAEIAYVGTTDSDNDGLLNEYDANDAACNPTNGTTPSSYPDVNKVGGDRDWRQISDKDNDGIADNVDVDDDNDGITDLDENGAVDPLADADSDGIPNYLDASYPSFVDANSDGINDNFDKDKDGIINSFDLDSDNDGITDVIEAGGTDADNDGIIGSGAITDTDGDGLSNIVDSNNGGTALANPDTDGDGISNYLDLDSDNDGIPDLVEAGGVDTNGDGRIDSSTDTDADGLMDVYDANNSGDAISNYDTDGDGVKNIIDLDSDNDGIPDVIEAGGTDADNNGKIDGFTDTDADGFSQSVDGDTNNDGTVENTAAALIITSTDGNSDGKPDSYSRSNTDGTGLPNPYDLDSDDDGILDVREAGFTDATNDGIADGMLGADGWSDTVDALANLNIPNTDSHGAANYLDIDSDNDGIVDNIEAQSTAGYIAPSGSDTDADGIDNAYDNNDAAFGGNATNGLAPVNTDAADNADYLDLDSDNDGKTDRLEGWDSDGNGSINGAEIAYVGTTDSDNDGLLNEYDANDAACNPTNGTTPSSYPDMNNPGGDRDWRQASDNDMDGVADNVDVDDDNDGITDLDENGAVDPLADGDNDGTPNYLDLSPGSGLPAWSDSNSDNINDAYDKDKDGIINSFDLDSDNDGITDVIEAGGTDADNDGIIGTGAITDTDGDGLSNIVDSNNGGTALANLDSDGDGVKNFMDLDSDGDGILDVREAGFADANNDGIVDGTLGTDGWSNTIDALANLNLTNSDLHGNPNYLDIDSDNDGIVDNIEAQTTAGYIAPSGSDSDNDGIDNAYDNNDNSFGGNSSNGITPEDTDTDGNPDYIDADADDDSKSDLLEGWDTNGNNYIDGSEIYFIGTSDADGDGLFDEYDANDAVWNPTNGTSPTSYPDENSPGNDRDWRELDPDGETLPVEFISANVKLIDTKAIVSWATASELNNDFFEVQKSINSIDFETAGIIDGSGNSNSIHNYTFVDNKPLNGISYYRIKQVDFDGNHSFSSILVLNNKSESQLNVSIYPNPTNGITNFVINANASIEILDVAGKLMYKFKNSSDIKNEINLSFLKNGLYILRISTANETLTRDLIINK